VRPALLVVPTLPSSRYPSTTSHVARSIL
jgi:hypothetical protein